MGRSYHHGDLANALVEAGLDLARAGGADAIGLREVTRVAGVSPNAAYRHFADREALVAAVAARARDEAAAFMRDRLENPPRRRSDRARAIDRLRAIGLGYVDFALEAPQLFQLAFSNPDPTDPSAAEPFRLLLGALDDLVTAGALAPRRRPDAEWACWSAVHGLADLATRGPLRARSRADLEGLASSVVDRVVAGVLAPPVT